MYAPPSPHHMPSSLRARVTWPAANCLRTDTDFASRSGTSTQSTPYTVPIFVARERSSTNLPPESKHLKACRTPRVVGEGAQLAAAVVEAVPAGSSGRAGRWGPRRPR